VSTRDSAPAQGPDDLDDEALSWAGDEDRGGVAPRRSGATATDAATDAASDAVEADPMGGQAGDEPDAGQTEPTPSSPARTAATVVFATLYLAIVLGWVLSVQSTSSGSTELFVDITWQFGEFMALVAGVLWFGAVLTLTRTRPTLERVGWWALGTAILVPWPLVFVVISEASA
tara:strand:- start:63129 stop:63650 length:522 start_codon:yes stop_codon:yes gene_type:complete